MNTLYKKDLVTGEIQKYHRGMRHFFQEPQFIPRYPDAPEGDGFLVSPILVLSRIAVCLFFFSSSFGMFQKVSLQNP